MSAPTISRSKAILAATKRLPFKTDAAILKHIDLSGFDALDAYKVGAEEAQEEIIRRLQALPPYPAPRAASTVGIGDKQP